MEHPSVKLATPKPGETREERYKRLRLWDIYCGYEHEVYALQRAAPLSANGVRLLASLKRQMETIEQGTYELSEL